MSLNVELKLSKEELRKLLDTLNYERRLHVILSFSSQQELGEAVEVISKINAESIVYSEARTEVINFDKEFEQVYVDEFLKERILNLGKEDKKFKCKTESKGLTVMYSIVEIREKIKALIKDELQNLYFERVANKNLPAEFEKAQNFSSILAKDPTLLMRKDQGEILLFSKSKEGLLEIVKALKSFLEFSYKVPTMYFSSASKKAKKIKRKKLLILPAKFFKKMLAPKISEKARACRIAINPFEDGVPSEIVGKGFSNDWQDFQEFLEDLLKASVRHESNSFKILDSRKLSFYLDREFQNMKAAAVNKNILIEYNIDEEKFDFQYEIIGEKGDFFDDQLKKLLAMGQKIVKIERFERNEISIVQQQIANLKTIFRVDIELNVDELIFYGPPEEVQKAINQIHDSIQETSNDSIEILFPDEVRYRSFKDRFIKEVVPKHSLADKVEFKDESFKITVFPPESCRDEVEKDIEDLKTQLKKNVITKLFCCDSELMQLLKTHNFMALQNKNGKIILGSQDICDSDLADKIYPQLSVFPSFRQKVEQGPGRKIFFALKENFAQRGFSNLVDLYIVNYFKEENCFDSLSKYVLTYITDSRNLQPPQNNIVSLYEQDKFIVVQHIKKGAVLMEKDLENIHSWIKNCQIVCIIPQLDSSFQSLIKFLGDLKEKGPDRVIVLLDDMENILSAEKLFRKHENCWEPLIKATKQKKESNSNLKGLEFTEVYDTKGLVFNWKSALYGEHLYPAEEAYRLFQAITQFVNDRKKQKELYMLRLSMEGQRTAKLKGRSLDPQTVVYSIPQKKAVKLLDNSVFDLEPHIKKTPLLQKLIDNYSSFGFSDIKLHFDEDFNRIIDQFFLADLSELKESNISEINSKDVRNIIIRKYDWMYDCSDMEGPSWKSYDLDVTSQLNKAMNYISGVQKLFFCRKIKEASDFKEFRVDILKRRIMPTNEFRDFDQMMDENPLLKAVAESYEEIKHFSFFSWFYFEQDVNFYYQIDINDMYQMNLETNKKRKVKLEKKEIKNLKGNWELHCKDLGLKESQQHEETSKIEEVFDSGPEFYALVGDSKAVDSLEKEIEVLIEENFTRTYEFSPLEKEEGALPEEIVQHLQKRKIKYIDGKIILKGNKSKVESMKEEIFRVLYKSKKSFSFPNYWDPMTMTDNCHVKNLNPKSPEFERASLRFMETMVSIAEIISIQLIQNKILHTNFMASKMVLKGKSVSDSHELLFHGTRSNDPEVYYKSMDQAFDFRLSSEGLWGYGAYFAKDAYYSHFYSYSKGDPFIRQMFLASVNLGMTIELPQDRSLRRPPMRNELPGFHYDSVTGITQDHRVYIIYDNAKSYPEFLITYRVLDKANIPG